MMRCRRARLLGCLFSVAAAQSCAPLRLPPAETTTPVNARPITAESVGAHVLALAADDLEGRGAGYRGEEKAADYIARCFRRAGLTTSLQTFGFLPRAPEQPGDVLTSHNVLAVLPGDDPHLSGEVVVVGAHHDGQGKIGQADGGRYPGSDPASQADTIWNSADDNASSVAAIIEIARALAGRDPRSRRTIVFATFGAEEHALNGSAHLAQNPWPGGSRCVAMVNLEKIGRVPDQSLVMAGCATSFDWAQVLSEANARAGHKIECLLPDLVPDTDHYPFGALGIPAIVLGTVHEEDTHRPTDEISRLDFEALARRATYVQGLVEILANRERLPTFDPETRRGAGLLAVAASPSERASLALGDHGALKISVLLPGLPAAKAGLQIGDFVTTLDGKPFASAPDERAIQNALAERSSANLIVRRGDTTFTVRVEATSSAGRLVDQAADGRRVDIGSADPTLAGTR